VNVLQKQTRVRFLAFTMAAVLILPPPEGAYSTASMQPGPSFGVSPISGPAGAGITLLGENWQGDIDVTIRWDGQDWSTFHISPNGSFATPFTVPVGAAPGDHTITVCLGVPCPTGEFFVGRDANFTVVPQAEPPTPEPPQPPAPQPPQPPKGPSEEPSVPIEPSLKPTEISNPSIITTRELPTTPGQPPQLRPREELVRCNPPALATIIDFDDQPPGSLVQDAYAAQGIVIPSPGGVGIVATVPGMGAFSPPIAIKHNPGGREFGSFGEVVSIQFTHPQNSAGMYVGLDEETDGPVLATLTAMDAEGHSIASDSVGLGPGPTPVNVCMYVQQSGPNPQIVSLELSYDGVAGEVLDHLFFTQIALPEHPPSGEVVVDIRGPTEGSELLSLTQDIWGVVNSTSDIEYVELSQKDTSSSTSLLGRASLVRDAATGEVVFFLRRASFSPDVRSITAVAHAADGALGEDTVNLRVATRVRIAAIQNFNVQVAAVEVTQAVRGDIPTFSRGGLSIAETAVHVANRRTIVRVYPKLAVTSGTFTGGLSARLVGTRAGAALPGSPLNPVNPVLEIDPAWTLPEMREDAARSWNFVLPDEWIEEGIINLTIEVNPAGPNFRPECPGCNSDNLNFLTGVRFRPTGAVTFYPYLIQNHPATIGTTTPGVSPTIAELLTSFLWVQRTWPIPDDGLGIARMRRIASDCIPGSPSNTQPNTDSITGLNCDTQFSAVTAARAQSQAKGVTPGDPSLFPIITSASSSRDCAGRAGLPSPVYWSGACGPTLAQESWHAAGGFNHAGTSHGELTGGGNDPGYPNAHGAIEANAYGFDVIDMRAIGPTAGPGPHTHDFMSYGGLDFPGSEWVSIYTWQNIAAWLGAPDVRAQNFTDRHAPALLAYPATQSLNPNNSLRLSGQIYPDDTVVFDPAFQSTLPSGAANQEGEGSYRLELRGTAGDLLFTRRFEPFEVTHVVGGRKQFYENLPITPGVSEVVLFREDTELTRLRVTSTVPQINLLSPSGGERWEATGRAIISWEAGDIDGNELMYLVEASPDDGQTWIALSVTELTQTTLDLSNVPGSGEGWRVRVQASDGFNVGLDEVEGISVAPKPPQPLIFHPLEGAVFVQGESLMLTGKASDFQDGQLPDAALEWSVDGTVVGHGLRWPVFDLGLGQHIVSLRATNQVGLADEMQVTINVIKGSSQPGFMESLLDFLRQRFVVIIILVGGIALGVILLFLVMYVRGLRR